MKMLHPLVQLCVLNSTKSKLLLSDVAMLIISKILIYLSYFSGIVPLYFLYMKRQHPRSGVYKLLALLLLLSVLSDLIIFLLAKSSISNIAVVNTYFLLLFLVLSLIYADLLKEYKKIIFTICFLFTVFFIVNSIYIQSINSIQSYTSTISGLILLLYSILYSVFVIKFLPANNLIWINIGVVFYFSFNLFLFIISTYVFTNMGTYEMNALWSFHNVNNIIKNILFAVGVCYTNWALFEKTVPLNKSV
jgi:hypothetical protein